MSDDEPRYSGSDERTPEVGDRIAVLDGEGCEAIPDGSSWTVKEVDCGYVFVGSEGQDGWWPNRFWLLQRDSDFQCRVCGVMCNVSPGPGQAICEDHCEDHEYEHDSYERGWFCKHCYAPAPDDYGRCDDDVPLSFHTPGEQIGTPLSQVTGEQLDRMANEWRNL